MVPLLSALSLAFYHEALEGGENHLMETSIAKRNKLNHKMQTRPLFHIMNHFKIKLPSLGGSHEMIATKIWISSYLNAHRIQRFLKTYRIQNFALIPPQPANENQDLSCSFDAADDSCSHQ